MSGRFVARRLIQVPFALLAILLITFLLVRFVPGDPARTLVGENASEEEVEGVRQALGYDKPVPQQFLRFVGRAIQGDLGISYVQGRPVAQVIRDYARPTLILTGTALVMSTVFGMFFALASARRPDGWIDRGISTVMLVIYAIPGFWIAHVAIIYLVLKHRWFPLQGYSEIGSTAPTGVAHLADVAYHVMLPAMVLAITEVAAVARVLRAGLIGELQQGYVRTAEAKGLRAQDVLANHALRNAMLPMVTLVGARIGFLLSGAAIIEGIFSWPGLGSLLLYALDTQDRPLILGMVLVSSVAIMAANLLTDLAYAWIDPRIRHG